MYNLAASLGLAPSIKWPNDVLVAGKKICGILLEMEGTFDALSWLVVGFGLNVNTTAFPEELIHIATSLAAECGRELNRSDIMAQLLNNLEPLFDACAQESSFQSLLSQYRECCATIGQTLTVTGVAEQLQGVAEGIDEMGMLLLRTADGVLHAVAAGDVTLRADALANETGE
ncbi:biotin--[acetyl-CoA-carboxylase] ligase [Christensenellaceae bacterium OttesenSCG-928-L17]|nr:biotin--[acetyl-CoA-carboxylase] ligase [Christensenellaceae bacterium OttesenSCG-928-L17]